MKLSKVDSKLLLQALSDGVEWQNSLEDAHRLSIPEHHRSAWMNAVARRAVKKAQQYRSMMRKIIMARLANEVKEQP
jgi:hypothetical protein